MRNRFIGSAITLVAVLALSPVAFAQTGQQGAQKAPAASNKPFDVHDVSGFWDITNIGRPSGAVNETSNNRPPMTDWAKEQFHKTKTGYNSKELSNGVYKQKDRNDPLLLCDPTGFPRIMWNPAKPPGMRFVQTPEEVIQFFEDGRTWRDLWMDGRKLPGDDAEPRWYGYAVAHWDGDTLVVNSDGYDDRTWLDQYGSPHSDQLTVEERYHRADHDHLEMFVNITDPKAYSGTWKGDKKIFQWVDNPARSPFNDLPEKLCVWSDVGRK